MFPLLDRNVGRLLTAFVGSRITGGASDTGLSSGASSIEIYNWKHYMKTVKNGLEVMNCGTEQGVGLVTSYSKTSASIL